MDGGLSVRPNREQVLSANPNCVSFATDAAALLDGRSWSELQQLAAAVVLPFHQASALATQVGYAWRIALDRQNNRHTQGTLYFVFDGPATSAHLDTLELAVHQVDRGFGQATIERVPANGAVAVVAVDGECHGVWTRDVTGGEPWVRKLESIEGRVRPVVMDAEDIGPNDVWTRLKQVVGVPPTYGIAEQEAERMRLAFALRFTDEIVRADGVVRESEAEFVDSLFPSDLVERLGLDESAARDEYFAAAKELLPAQLGYHDKLGLIGLFFSACYSDGSLDAREMRVLKEAGEMLGLTKEEVVKYLRRFW
jgi:uncharacterized tellurite resistance protein B-like protein